jgi:hypothetical protein
MRYQRVREEYSREERSSFSKMVGMGNWDVEGDQLQGWVGWSSRLMQLLSVCRHRCLRLWTSADCVFLQNTHRYQDGCLAAISRGEFSLKRAAESRSTALAVRSAANSPEHNRRQSAPVSWLVRLLRAHGLLQKVPRTHRYQVTAPGPQSLNRDPCCPSCDSRSVGQGRIKNHRPENNLRDNSIVH